MGVVPHLLKDQLMAFMSELDLFSGSIDLIVDHEERYWFLECNQDGQWIWLDNILNGQISNRFAEQFINLTKSQLS